MNIKPHQPQASFFPTGGLYIALACMLFSAGLHAQVTRYVAAPNGLNLRVAPSADSPVRVKVPYGTRFEFPANSNTTGEFTAEGFSGAWAEVIHQQQDGFIFLGFCLPLMPPDQPGALTLEEYLTRTAPPLFGPRKFDHSAVAQATDIREVTVYSNGVVQEYYNGYEYNSTTWHLPGLTLQEAFLLCRLMKWENRWMSPATPFPRESSTSGGISLVVEVDHGMVQHIRMDRMDGEWYFMEFLYLEEKAVVIAGSRI